MAGMVRTAAKIAEALQRDAYKGSCRISPSKQILAATAAPSFDLGTTETQNLHLCRILNVKGERVMKAGMKAVALATSLALAGCASIVSKSEWPVTVQSNPSGARCVIAKENGVEIHRGETPLTTVLSAKGGYFSSQDYTITCEKEGHQTTQALMPSSLNGWYWGNIVFGGLIGILIVDPATGAMWKLDETKVVNLAKLQATEQSPSAAAPVAQSAGLAP